MHKRPLSRPKQRVFVAFLAVSWLALCGASCSKSAATDSVVVDQPPLPAQEPGEVADPRPQADPHGTHDHQEQEIVVNTGPLGDPNKLDGDGKALLEKMVNSLASPCGGATSLHKSAAAGCKQAASATSYVIELIADGAAEDDVKQFYEMAYKDQKRYTFKLRADMPHSGPEDAKVRIAEFYDYGCPACAAYYPLLLEVNKAYPKDVVIYYKQFPLSAHPDSPGAAACALAAHKQGKFPEMHRLLFTNQTKHKLEDLRNYAKSLGLDMNRWERDFVAAAAQVAADRKEAETLVEGTPTLFLNGRQYQGPGHPKYLKMWIDEELGLNQ